VIVEWSDRALLRMTEIKKYIARDDLAAAERLLDRFIERVESLSELPRQGRRMPEYPNVRELVVGRYRIVYRIRVSIEVLTVFEGHRLPPGEDLE
jgi:toxin ParE1/3/4